MSKYYVYILRRPSGVPFYVGKGIGSRATFHEWHAKRGGVGYIYNIIRKILVSGKHIIIEKVNTHLSSEQACEIEKQLIKRFGKKIEGGLLANITDGGEGAPGFKHDLVSISRMREAWTKRGPVKEETKLKQRAAMLGRKSSKETCEKISKSISGSGHWNYGKTITKEHAEKLHSSSRRCVVVDGKLFSSVRDAAIAYGISPTSAVYHLTCGKNRGGRHGVWCYAD